MIYRSIRMSTLTLRSLSLSSLLRLGLSTLPCRPDRFCSCKYLITLAWLLQVSGWTYSIDIHSIPYTNQDLLHDWFMIGIRFIVSEPHDFPGFSITIPIELYDSIIVLFSWLFNTYMSVLSHPNFLYGLTLPTPHPTYPYYQKTRMRSLHGRNPRAKCIARKPV
jgi:hypothetical protein